MPVPDEEIMDLLEQATSFFTDLGKDVPENKKTGHKKGVIFAFLFSSETPELLRVEYDLDWETGEVHLSSATLVTLLPPD